MERAREERRGKVAMARLAIDLILQQETSRGKELVLLEMQPAPVEEQTPLLKPSLYLFLAVFLSLSLFLSVSSPSPQLHRFALRWQSSRASLLLSLSRCHRKHSMQFERRAVSPDSVLYLSLSLSFLSSSYVNTSIFVSRISLSHNSLLKRDYILHSIATIAAAVGDSDCRL